MEWSVWPLPSWVGYRVILLYVFTLTPSFSWRKCRMRWVGQSSLALSTSSSRASLLRVSALPLKSQSLILLLYISNYPPGPLKSQPYLWFYSFLFPTTLPDLSNLSLISDFTPSYFQVPSRTFQISTLSLILLLHISKYLFQLTLWHFRPVWPYSNPLEQAASLL